MGVYRLLLTLLAPVFIGWALALAVFGRENRRDARQRLGFAPAPETAHATLWLHAASNGELASAEEVVRALVRKDPALHLLITTNSVTGRALARSWDLPQVQAILAPIDWRWTANRILHRWGVIGVVILESELWPNRILATSRRGLPVCVIGARLSRRTARAWGRAAWITRQVLANITWMLPQDQGSRRRMRRLGMDPVRLGPATDLKSLYDPAGKPEPDPDLMACFHKDHTWLAASTHPGEETVVLAAHLAARTHWPELELILAPRHPKRAAEIRRVAESLDLPIAQRSLGESPQSGAVYMADTLGEMPRFYANAEICLVAGSLVERGGHTPYEPAAFGCALLHGPFLRNFQAPYRQLDIAGGAIQVSDADSLATAVLELRDPDRRAALAQNAARALGTGAGPDPLAERLLHLAGRSPKSP